MKRLVLLFLLVAIVAWFTSVRQADVRHRRARAAAAAAAARSARVHVQPPRPVDRHDRDHDDADDSIAEARRAVAEARHEAHQAVKEAKAEVREALADASREVREALDQAAQEIREAVDGIPVPIVPGTRVTEAVAEAPAPPAPPRPPATPRAPRPPATPAPRHAPEPPAPPDPAFVRVVEGSISATKERAERDGRIKLEDQLGEWLEPLGVPRSWKPSPRQVNAMVLGTTVEAEEKPDPLLGTMYTAKLRVDASPDRLADLARTYRRQLVNRRMAALGGVLAFVLICLAAVSGYIRADEATKGYYTNRLRMLAAAGVGAAGVVIYQMVA